MDDKLKASIAKMKAVAGQTPVETTVETTTVAVEAPVEAPAEEAAPTQD
jgi:hypothetical protein